MEIGIQMIEHEHDYILIDVGRRYRDVERKEYVQDTYQCECGAGGYIRTPKELYQKGYESMELISV